MHVGKQGSNSGVFITRKIASTKVNDSLSNVDLQQLHPSKTGVHDDHSELCISDGEYRHITAVAVSMLLYYYRFRIQ